jgi:fibrillarin-like rRNA methylase
MDEILEKIDNLCTILEDAYEEKDWDRVNKVIEGLDELYEDIDRSTSGYGGDY